MHGRIIATWNGRSTQLLHKGQDLLQLLFLKSNQQVLNFTGRFTLFWNT